MSGGYEAGERTASVDLEAGESVSEKREAAFRFAGGVWHSFLKRILVGAGAGAAVGVVPAALTGQPAYMGIGAIIGGIAGTKVAMSKHGSWRLSE